MAFRAGELDGVVLYLHGFTSGPQSAKASALGRRMAERGLADRFLCPQLPASPAAAIALTEALVRQHPVTTLVGSSLGGFYATWLAEKFDRRAVLVNPAVVAHVSLERYLGPQRWLYGNDGDDVFEFTRDHIEELRTLQIPVLSSPERFWLLVEEGDETLDYRHAVARYAGSRQTVLPGGNHSFTRWESYLDPVLAFAGIGSQTGNQPGNQKVDAGDTPL